MRSLQRCPRTVSKRPFLLCRQEASLDAESICVVSERRAQVGGGQIWRQSRSKKRVTAASPASCSVMGVAVRGKIAPRDLMHPAERLGPTLQRWLKIAVGVAHSHVSGPTTYLAAACEPRRFVQKEQHILTPCVL